MVEIKETDVPDEKPKQLYADKEISIRYLNKELRLITFINKNKETKNGYLSLIFDGTSCKLYHRLAVKFSEGKEAANSMVADIPSRFIHFEEFYYQKGDVDRIDYLPSSKKKFIKQFHKDYRDPIKIYIKQKNISLEKEQHLIELFEFINTL